MKRNEIISLVTIAIASCPSAQEKDPEPIVNAWSLLLGDIPYEVAKAAVMKVCRSSRFFPSVAEIVDAAHELDPRTDKLPTAAEAWEEVKKLLSSVGPYVSERRPLKFSCLTVERATRAIGWQQLCGSENPEADRAHFMRIYESMRAKHKETSELNKALELSGMKDFVMALAGNMEVKQIDCKK